MEYRSRGVEETEALGERLGARLCPGDVVACRGPINRGEDRLHPGPGPWARVYGPGHQPHVHHRQ